MRTRQKRQAGELTDSMECEEVTELMVYRFFRDQLSITTWLSLGAVAQSLLFSAFGRLAFLPGATLILYRVAVAYLQATGWMHNPYMDGVIREKTSAQFPDASGSYGSTPANNDVVVLLIGFRNNHPLGILAPGAKDIADGFQAMAKDLDAQADKFDFLGMTTWLNANTRETQNEILSVGYFKTVEGLHAFAHDDLHRKWWTWWNQSYKKWSHMSIFHEVYHAPKGHWENIYINSHVSGIESTTTKVVDEETGKEMWASPIVDAGCGLLKTSAGRMSRSEAREHDKYGADPY
ncbi:hypothetical protein KC345_g7388 [Hortaea werneckii]|nr:hypothetical protein KC345_g7388 [Hortaea werneckii]